MQTFIISLLAKALTDPRVQEAIKKLVTEIVSEKILPLVPVAAASAAKAVIDMIPGVDAVVDAAEVAQNVVDDLNRVIPDIDTGIKPLDDLLDFWRPKS